jgi:hypothetical protein
MQLQLALQRIQKILHIMPKLLSESQNKEVRRRWGLMVLEPLIKERLYRKRRLLALIAHKPGFPKEAYIAHLSNETGVSWRTIQGYLRELVADRLIEEVEGKLYPSPQIEVSIHEVG